MSPFLGPYDVSIDGVMRRGVKIRASEVVAWAPTSTTPYTWVLTTGGEMNVTVNTSTFEIELTTKLKLQVQ